MFVRIFVAFDNVNIKHSVLRDIKCAIQHLLKTNKLFVPVIYGFLQWRQMKRVCDQKRIKRRERRKRAVRQSTAADGFTVIIEPLDKWTFLLVPKGVCASQQWNFASVICAQASSVKASYRKAHGLRTPNEGINQRNLKFWADVADKICFGRTYKFGIVI